MEQHEDENKRLVSAAEQSLFTSFNKELSGKITVSPQYIEQRVREVNGELWELTKHYFEELNGKHGDCLFDIGSAILN